MFEKKTLLIDMDQVLVEDRFFDFVKEFLGDIDLSKFEGYYVQDLLIGREEEYKKKYRAKNLYKADNNEWVEPIKDSVEVLKQLNEKYNVFIVTSYYWRDDVVDPAENLKNKFNYLAYFYPFLNKNNFVFLTEKTKLHFDIGIDDRIVNLKNCDKKLLFSEIRNKSVSDEELRNQGIKRVNSWLDVKKALL